MLELKIHRIGNWEENMEVEESKNKLKSRSMSWSPQYRMKPGSVFVVFNLDSMGVL